MSRWLDALGQTDDRIVLLLMVLLVILCAYRFAVRQERE